MLAQMTCCFPKVGVDAAAAAAVVERVEQKKVGSQTPVQRADCCCCRQKAVAGAASPKRALQTTRKTNFHQHPATRACQTETQLQSLPRRPLFRFLACVTKSGTLVGTMMRTMKGCSQHATDNPVVSEPWSQTCACLALESHTRERHKCLVDGLDPARAAF